MARWVKDTSRQTKQLFLSDWDGHNPKQVTKLTTLGYLDFDSRGDEKAEGIAIEAYLGDSL